MRIESSATTRDLSTLQGSILHALKVALARTASLAAQAARTTRAFKDRTGHLRGSIRHGVRAPFSHFVRAGGNGARHALFVEGGTQPHAIVARRKKFLRFVQNGHVRFAKRVKHRGTKPTRFMQSARDAAENAATGFFERDVSDAIRR